MQPSGPRPRAIAHILLVHAAFWTALCAAGALGVYADKLNVGTPEGYGAILLRWWVDHVPMLLLSSTLSLVLLRRPALFTDARVTLAIYLALMLLFLPAEWLYVAACDVAQRGEAVSLDAAWHEVRTMRRLGWFSEWAWTTGTYLAMVAIGNLREARARFETVQRAHADNLNLRLELAQQRMLALRAQLEPHFIFNALNAISSLVRTDDKRLALTGINRLSDLLRYALSASMSEQASIGGELQFVRDYLTLQRLRYGERLQVHIEGDDDEIRAMACPPLLLQPLIENALRHDLDCHDGPGEIRLSFSRADGALAISVSNRLGAGASPNPGTGLGLANTRARLVLANPDATLVAGPRGAHFVAEIRLPPEKALA